MRRSCAGGAVTVTVNVHARVVCDASVLVQRTVFVPTGNSEPDAGVQLVCTGAVPPDTAGVANVTAMPLEFAAATV